MKTWFQPWVNGTSGWRLLLLFKLGWIGLVLQPQIFSLPVVLLGVVLIGQLDHARRLAFVSVWACGVGLDAGLWWLGLFEFTNPVFPYWLLLLWGWFSLFWLMLFSRWLHQPLPVALFGFFAGPAAYWGGAQLSELLQIINAPLFWFVMAPAWATFMLWARHVEIWWHQYCRRNGKGGQHAVQS